MFLLLLLCWLLWLLLALIFLRAVASWFPIDSTSRMADAVYWLYRATEPVLGPARRVIPPVRMGNTAIDFSAMAVMFVLIVLANIVC